VINIAMSIAADLVSAVTFARQHNLLMSLPR
jgi:hypothetical protein